MKYATRHDSSEALSTWIRPENMTVPVETFLGSAFTSVNVTTRSFFRTVTWQVAVAALPHVTVMSGSPISLAYTVPSST